MQQDARIEKGGALLAGKGPGIGALALLRFQIIIVRSIDAVSRTGAASAPGPGCQLRDCTQSSCPISSESSCAVYRRPHDSNVGLGAYRVRSDATSSPGPAVEAGVMDQSRTFLSWDAEAR